MSKPLIKREDLPKISDILADADLEMKQHLENVDHTMEENRQRCYEDILEWVNDGTLAPVEGMIMLVYLGYDGEIPEYLQEQEQINFMNYPQYQTVEKAMGKRIDSAPCCALLDSYVAEDFLESYARRSISFEELIYRLAMLGRIPVASYFRMAPAQRRALGKDVELFHIW